jgi:hypothetical protein
MVVICQLHAPAALSPGKRAPLHYRPYTLSDAESKWRLVLQLLAPVLFRKRYGQHITTICGRVIEQRHLVTIRQMQFGIKLESDAWSPCKQSVKEHRVTSCWVVIRLYSARSNSKKRLCSVGCAQHRNPPHTHTHTNKQTPNVPVLFLNWVLRHEGVLRSGGITPRIHWSRH